MLPTLLPPLALIDLSYAAVTIALVVIGAFVFCAFLASRYRRCPSNKILCVYGSVGGGRSVRAWHGGGTFVWPLIQDFKYLDLTPMAISIPLKNALSLQNIRVNVPSTFTIAINTTEEHMNQAAIRLLDLDQRQIEQMATEIIFGQLRLTVASLTIEQINQDRERFLEAIRKNVESELGKVGLSLINVNVTDITDESGYIEAIGKKAAATAIQQARGDVAEQEKLGEIRVAEAVREKDISVAGANKDRLIGTRHAQREQAVRVADLDKEQKVGEQSAAFLREAQVKEAEQAMRVSIASANAKAVSGENTAQATIAKSQAELQVKQAEAYQLGETRKREAEAGVQEAQNRAMTKAALAQADRIEAERRAALEAPAKAEKAKMIVDAEADAEKRRIQAQGEASAIYAKLEAEARGQYEILAKKGEGLKQIVEACGGSEQAFKLLMLEHLDTLAETSAKAISNIKFDKVVVWDSGHSPDGQGGATSNFLKNLAHTLPPMLQVMKDVGGVQMPDYIAKLTSDVKKPEPAATGTAAPAAKPANPDPAPPKDGTKK
ncbi:MAG: flotillin family protein [Planctomycetes bacterium]|nr:flotillin family protein [Planctomycetota bacterium]